MKCMFYTITLVFITILFSVESATAQRKYLYIIAVDSAVAELSAFKQPSGFYDINRLRAIGKADFETKSERFRELKLLLDEIRAISIRKLIRRLPDDVRTFRTRRGTNEPVEFLQRLYVVEVSSPITEKRRDELLAKYKRIKNLEKDPVIQVDAWPPNDPYYLYQSQFFSTPYNINLPRAWDFTAGNPGIKVAIVDHGIDYNHTDLGNGIGVGYRIRGGWDWKDNDPYPLPTYSTETHGTPIAGIIGAINWNNTGVIGIAGGSSSAIESGCQLFSFRVTSEEVQNRINLIQTSLVTEAVFEAATDPSLNNGYRYGVHVINCSFGGPDPHYWDWNSLTYRSFYFSFAWAYLNNVVVTAARGNDGNTEPRYPASFSNGDVLISVSGVDNSGILHSRSSYGDGVTISAPWYLGLTTGNGNTYHPFAGTSNAAPMVAGVAALILSKFKERGITVYAEDVREIFKISAQQTNDPTRYGAGRLDAGRALYLSSQTFHLQHVVATKNRTVTTVPNPSGNKLALYYPYGVYIVQETKRIVASVDVPDYLLADSSWVWANSYSNGLKWGNPSYGMPGASLVSRNGREYTFEMFVYRLRDLAGNDLGWYPSDPNTANIHVTILGKIAPLSVSISGPTTAPCKTATWTANVSGGVSLYSYVWYQMFCNDDGPNIAPCEWHQVGTGNPIQLYWCAGNGYLRVDVTDAQGSFASAQIYIVGAGGGGIEPKSLEQGNIASISIPTEFSISQNYPNPFNPETEIKFALPENSKVTITITDILGREVIRLVQGEYTVGYHRVRWDGRDKEGRSVGSGVYFYRFTAIGESGRVFDKVMKMVLAR